VTGSAGPKSTISPRATVSAVGSAATPQKKVHYSTHCTHTHRDTHAHTQRHTHTHTHTHRHPHTDTDMHTLTDWVNVSLDFAFPLFPSCLCAFCGWVRPSGQCAAVYMETDNETSVFTCLFEQLLLPLYQAFCDLHNSQKPFHSDGFICAKQSHLGITGDSEWRRLINGTHLDIEPRSDSTHNAPLI